MSTQNAQEKDSAVITLEEEWSAEEVESSKKGKVIFI